MYHLFISCFFYTGNLRIYLFIFSYFMENFFEVMHDLYKEEGINRFRMLYIFILNEYVLFIYLFIYLF